MLTNRDTRLPLGRLAAATIAMVIAILVLVACDGRSGAAVTSTPPPVAKAHGGKVCDRVAGHGGGKHRLHTVAGLIRHLHHGQTGCLEHGIYGGAAARQLQIHSPGVTLRSYPGQRATIRGALWVAAPRVTVAHLKLNGENPRGQPSPILSRNHDALVADNITNHHNGICVSLGSRGYGRPQHALIQGSRIHDCGQLDPDTNRQHGIYVAYADHTVIRNNLIYDNADRGIQLYPDAQGSRIMGNVIDGNGEGIIFGGSGSDASSHNRVQRNIITNSLLRGNIESSFPETAIGRGNIVRFNCVSGASAYPGLTRAGIQLEHKGFRALNNVFARPGYINPGDGRFRLSRHSRCRGLGLAVRLHRSARYPGVASGTIPGTSGAVGHSLRVEARIGGQWVVAGTKRVFTRRFQLSLGHLRGAHGRTPVRVALKGRPRSNPVRIRVNRRD